MDSKRINLARGSSAPTTALIVAALLACQLSLTTAAVGVQQTKGSPVANGLATTSAAETNPTELFALGASFYTSGEWHAAIEQFKSLVDRYPNDEKSITTLFYLAESLMQTGATS